MKKARFFSKLPFEIPSVLYILSMGFSIVFLLAFVASLINHSKINACIAGAIMAVCFIVWLITNMAIMDFKRLPEILIEKARKLIEDNPEAAGIFDPAIQAIETTGETAWLEFALRDFEKFETRVQATIREFQGT